MTVRTCWLSLLMLFALSPLVRAADDHAPSTSETVAGEHASGHDDRNYNFPPLWPDPPLLVFSIIFFGCFVLLMRPLVWNPLIQSLNSREARIAHAENEARSISGQIKELSAQADKRLAEVQEQVGALLAQARSEAETSKSEIIARAEQDSRRVRDEALVEIARARETALRELEASVDETVASAVEHVAGQRL